MCLSFNSDLPVTENRTLKWCFCYTVFCVWNWWTYNWALFDCQQNDFYDITMYYVQDLTILSFEQVIRCVSHSWLPYKHSVFEMMENHHHAYVLCMQTETIYRYTLVFSSFMCIKITLYCWHDSNRTFTLRDSWSCLLHQE